MYDQHDIDMLRAPFRFDVFVDEGHGVLRHGGIVPVHVVQDLHFIVRSPFTGEKPAGADEQGTDTGENHPESQIGASSESGHNRLLAVRSSCASRIEWNPVILA